MDVQRPRTNPAVDGGGYERSLIEASLDPLVTIAPDGTVTDVNRATETITGRTRADLIGTDFSNYFTEPVLARKGYLAVLRAGEVRDYALEIRHTDGHATPVLYNATVYRDAAGQVAGVFAAARDVTAQRRAEAELQLAEETFRALAANASDGILVAVGAGTHTYVNPRAAEITGYGVAELIGTSIHRLIPDDQRPIMEERYRKRLAGEDVPLQYETAIVRRDGTRVPLELTGARTTWHGQSADLVIVRDISERKRLEAEAARQAALIRAINRVSRQALTCGSEAELGATCLAAAEELTGSEFGFLDELNPRGLLDVIAISDLGWAACRMTGPPAALRDLTPQRIYRSVIEEGRSVLANDPAAHPEWRGLPDGHPPVRCFLGVPLLERERIFGLLALANKPGGYSGADQEDVEVLSVAVVEALQRKRAELALAAERERLAVTLRSIGDGVITTDVAGRVQLLNRVAEELTGWTQDEAAGRPLTEVFRIVHEQTRQPCEDPVAKVLASGRIVGLANHTLLVARNGVERVLADSGAPIFDPASRICGVVLVFRDVTEKQRLEEELQKAQKLESVGLLAGGIAHDFNNLLTGILGNVSLAQLQAEPGSQQAGWLRDAEKAVARARDLTQQLLTFAKGGAPVRRTARIGELIMDSTCFSLRGSDVRCEFTIADDLWPVEVDEGQLSQVIGNLVLNADEAMPEGGTARVGAHNLPAGAPRPPALPEGRYVVVSVTDEGIGIPESHLPRIFDPYFTTKKKGSGLGLATSFAIVHKHDGLITVESRPGKGSSFEIYLPASPKEPEPGSTLAALQPGSGRVLVMDDEELVRSVCSQMLAHLGYTVETASDGAEALVLFAAAQHAGRPFDAVLLDLTVPGGMGGKEAVGRLLALDPQARVLVTSGYSNDPIMADHRSLGFQGSVIKPFEVRELGRALREVLARRP